MDGRDPGAPTAARAAGAVPRAPDAPAGPPWPRLRRVLRGAGASLLLAAPVVAIAVAVRGESSYLHGLDVRAVAGVTDLTRAEPALHAALLGWQEVTQPGWLVLAGAGVCLWAARRHGLGSRALWGVVTMLAAWGTSTVVKQLVQRARPALEDPLAHASGFSFPSGHAVGAAAVGAVLTTVLWPLLGRRARVLVATAAAAVAVLTAADRVLLGVHHPSDVVAGLLLGCAVTAGSWFGRSAAPPPARADGGVPADGS
ncbi:phosphatase PAP2 family protein [Cellulomonas shaoxiangyii]|uniref:Phosphatase PAP2 family protein n=1 Tax=Cellulomonas shaoxiangyii TaxID=2566013 RepID=A0A4V1CMM2_9CELL|nr:phosphatase PAP2 family protein [Cellulomonas shaoxiangyii]QCB93435.1 phosphatase PAP2 family protein [Cellulomonas shaoxiangyii]TGY84552.1 phosphatase PAP2 family protein [Cellulomonas shaoxiangyii]